MLNSSVTLLVGTTAPDESAAVSKGTGPLNNPRLQASDLIGTWILVNHGFVNQDNQFKPTAQEMSGQLIYTDKGFMSVLITTKANAKKLEDLIAYSGSYSIENDKLFHHIQVAPSIKRVHTTEVRLPAFTQNCLILRTEPTAEGYYEITWEKANYK